MVGGSVGGCGGVMVGTRVRRAVEESGRRDEERIHETRGEVRQEGWRRRESSGR